MKKRRSKKEIGAGESRKKLNKRAGSLLRKMRKTGHILKGSLVERNIKCGKPT